MVSLTQTGLASRLHAQEKAAIPALTFLGTGCAEPSKHRGSSGILIKHNGGYILLECGEGTSAALKRLYVCMCVYVCMHLG